jgi:hypothetical protein
MYESDVIANLALEAYVSNKSLTSLGVDARKISRVGISVRIAISYIEEINEVIAVLDRHTH